MLPNNGLAYSKSISYWRKYKTYHQYQILWFSIDMLWISFELVMNNGWFFYKNSRDYFTILFLMIAGEKIH